jgi:hypothetical protein
VARTPVRRLIEKGIEAGADYIPDVIETPLRKAFSIGVPKSKARKPKASLAVNPKALPAPPKQLALPAPGPGLPPFAVKLKGGQWMVDKPFKGVNLSAENAARGILARAQRPQDEDKAALYDWWHKALPRYMKNEMATPEDPLRDLAARGLLHVDKTPDEWSELAGSVVNKPSLQNLLYNESSGWKDELLSEMPWLAKAPATDSLYGITPFNYRDLEFGHVADELETALRANQNGLPPELALRPESLQRMSFPAAVERVGRINQFRVKEMERAALSNMDSPAVQTFKEYADDNPMGLRWTELRSPGDNAPLPEGWMPDGKAFYNDYTGESQLAHPSLQDALKYEGDTMGHCVGGYCDDVASGRSRIFSLRDAKGQPHVTIETRPGGERKALSEIPRDALDEITADAMAETNAVTGPMGISMDDPRWTRTYQTNLGLKQREWVASNPLPDEIIQIKGKQNAKPKDDYLPFVQDFVKSQNWANIGDMQNTGLVRLPDGRYITGQQAEEIISAIPETTEMVRAFASSEMVPMRRVYDPTGLDRLDPEEWRAISQHFEGYAVGGRVCANRCFSKGKSAVYAVNKSRK